MPTSSKPFPCVGIRTCSDYSPFGVELDGRTVSGGYRYGFNGKEKTDEISGPCNSYDFGARMHDPRIGRFLVLDPKTAVYPMFSPYCFANNSPVLFVDANGEGPIVSWLIKQMTYNKKENSAFLSYQINVHRTVYIVNSSKMNLNAEAKSAICSNISKGYTAASFSYNLTQSEIAGIDQFIDRQYSHIPNNANLTINVQMQFSATVQFVNSLDEITDGNAGGDAIQVLADEISPRAVNLNGFSLPGKNTTVHEFLHLDGATDLNKYKKGVLVKSDASIMGGNNGLLTPNMQTKSEIATFYFRSTRMAIDLEQKNIYLGQKEAGITDLEGKQNFRLDTTKETNKQELKHLRNK